MALSAVVSITGLIGSLRNIITDVIDMTHGNLKKKYTDIFKEITVTQVDLKSLKESSSSNEALQKAIANAECLLKELRNELSQGPPKKLKPIKRDEIKKYIERKVLALETAGNSIQESAIEKINDGKDEPDTDDSVRTSKSTMAELQPFGQMQLKVGDMIDEDLRRLIMTGLGWESGSIGNIKNSVDLLREMRGRNIFSEEDVSRLINILQGIQGCASAATVVETYQEKYLRSQPGNCPEVPTAAVGQSSAEQDEELSQRLIELRST